MLCNITEDIVCRIMLLFAMLLAIGTLLAAPTDGKSCIYDRDCQDGAEKVTGNSLFCVENVCRRLSGAGELCKVPQECASYGFFGPIACTEECASTKGCAKKQSKQFCCRGIKESVQCDIRRPYFASGCGAGLRCGYTVDGESVCMGYGWNNWILGIFLSINGNMFINIGLNIQKRSYRVPYIQVERMRLSLFAIGTVVYVIGKISGFSSYIFGNQSLLAGLGAVGLVANSIFAPVINKEIFTVQDFFAIIFVLAGSSVMVMSGKRNHRIFSQCELVKMYYRKTTIAWFGLLVCCITCLYLFVRFVERNSPWDVYDDFVGRLLTTSHVFFEEGCPMLERWMLILYIALSGAIASFTSLFAKSFGGMVEKTMQDDNQFFYVTTYVFLCMIFVCTFLQIYWINRALKRYDALLVIPVFHVFWTLLSISTAGIYFQDFSQYTGQELVRFVLGMALIFVGSGFLAFRIRGKNKIHIKKSSAIRSLIF